MLKRSSILLPILLIGLLCAPSYAADAAKLPRAKNIILMISDGCGFNQVEAASLFQYGAPGKQIYEQFPVKYAMSTFSLGSYDPKAAWADFKYVLHGPTDSAAAATAMATGSKTYDAAIGMDKDKQPLTNVMQRAEALKKATGVVTTVPISHATPASFVAHNEHRNNYEQIAVEMLQKSATDVIMGCGGPGFTNSGTPKADPQDFKYVGGQATWESLAAGTLGADADGDGVADPWTLVRTRAEFQALGAGKTPKRVCGIAHTYSTLQQERAGDAKAEPFVVPLNEHVPTLAEMAQAALNVLDDDPDGFVLMIEGGAVDWASHANQSGRVIEEEVHFNKAVEAVVAWVAAHSNWEETLLIVTGDHETGYLTGPGSNPEWKPLVNKGEGVQPEMQWHTGGHTNSLIPLFAKGDAARLFDAYADQTDPVRGKYIDNTEIAKVIFTALEGK